MDGRDTWRLNFVLLFIWIILYQVTQIVVLELLPVSVAHPIRCSNFRPQTTKQRGGGTASGLFAKETSETRRLNNRLRKRKAGRLQARAAGKGDSKDIDLKRDVT
jgi:hypothetical protein